MSKIDDLNFEGGMMVAARESLFARCSRLSVGAALFCDGQLEAVGHNGPPKQGFVCTHEPGDTSACTTAVHAEEMALGTFPANVSGDWILYVTHEPCFSCAVRISLSPVKFVVYAHSYRSGAQTGGLASGLQFLEERKIQAYKWGPGL